MLQSSETCFKFNNFLQAEICNQQEEPLYLNKN